MWDVIVSVPDHCLSFYFTSRFTLCRDLRFSVLRGPLEQLHFI